ncbi:flavin reductase [Planosporangium flavigriseum]|nr:flavin reductase [Planosporangium flavigriseum]NJC67954.1 flavin reductase [Planosporangium flavigriseum]
MARVNVHIPIRPNWVCAGCGAPWPCPTRRNQLLAEFDRTPVSLRLIIGGHFMDCCADLPNREVGELYGRFLGWLWEQPEPYDGQEP